MGKAFFILLRMSIVMMFGGQMPIVKVGRMAGQFAKPRSDNMEEKDGVKLPSYRGDNVNGDAFDSKSRTPDPQRLIRASCQSLYRELAHRVDEALGFMSAAGLTIDHPIMSTTEIQLQGVTMVAPPICFGSVTVPGQLDGAHVEFLRGVANPLGIKVGDKMDPNDLVKLIEILNPRNKAGRITVIVRMGAENIRVKIPHLIGEARRSGQIVTWVGDPMHGNTIKAPPGLKTRPFDAIRADVRAFFDVHEQEGSNPEVSILK
ncbi:hypothetical protein MKW92_019953 [Papaver armeniacum]|nr:hypothetical protein MKW92_019953 [Papaver armeniacum]